MVVSEKTTYDYTIETTLAVIGGRWKPIILVHLMENGVMRSGELKRAITGISQRVMTNQLRELEADRVVNRKIYSEVPPKVEYSLTDHGKTLHPVLIAMCNWGGRHMKVK